MTKAISSSGTFTCTRPGDCWVGQCQYGRSVHSIRAHKAKIGCNQAVQEHVGITCHGKRLALQHVYMKALTVPENEASSRC